MDAEISNGLEVMGNHHGSENGIYAHRSIKTDANILAAGDITSGNSIFANYFHGNGGDVTYTAD
jgi:hypothetical protein